MRISELSRRSDVPVPTIKYYLREGLLHEGVHTSATQAQYDASHEARLRLIRALVGPGGCSIAAVHRVIQAIENPPRFHPRPVGRRHEWNHGQSSGTPTTNGFTS